MDMEPTDTRANCIFLFLLYLHLLSPFLFQDHLSVFYQLRKWPMGMLTSFVLRLGGLGPDHIYKKRANIQGVPSTVWSHQTKLWRIRGKVCAGVCAFQNFSVMRKALEEKSRGTF
jgi:hypothetical protein